MSSPTDCLNDVFSRHYEDLVRWCKGRVRPDLGDPEDFVHMAYLRCRKHWSRERQSREHEASYLYRALRCVIIDVLRSDLRAKSRTCGLHRSGNSLRCLPLRELVTQEALGILTGKQRQVCSALLAGTSTMQICKRLGLTPGALAVHLCRAKARLSDFLEIPNRKWRPKRVSEAVQSAPHISSAAISP